MTDKKERYLQIREEVRGIPVSDIIATRIDVTSRGNSTMALCPFHPDTSLGSFVITDNKGIWHCFVDNLGGDGPKFIAEFDGISYGEAILKVAIEFGIIEEGEAKRLSKGTKEFKPAALHFTDKRHEVDIRAEESILHYVYSIFKKGLRLIGEEDSLSKEHREYLHKRGIDDVEIEKHGYFTIPTRWAMKNILTALTKRNLDANTLLGVPGFYYDKVKKKITFAPTKGIGIPIVNENKKIIGIQIRRDEVKETQQRYIWLSSSFANSDNKDANMGCSPGAPVNVIFPKEVKTKSIFITEGHFKARVLSNTYQSYAVSVQGIGNWKPVGEAITKIRKECNKIKYLYIAYDADIAQNINVALQAIKMARSLQTIFKELEIYFMLWDEDVAKGIDDLLEIDKGSEIFKVEFSTFEKTYNDYLMRLMKYLDVLSISEISRKLMGMHGKEAKDILKRGYVKYVFNILKK